jgi:hypothetical protein
VAASVDPLATVDDLTTYLGHPPANPQQAEWMLDGASAFVRTHCGWSISRETDVVWPRDASGGRLLTLPTLRLVAVASVLVDVPEWAGMLYRESGWPDALQSVTVVGTHGYTAEEMPRDIMAVVCGLSSRMASAAGKGSATVQRVGNVQTSYNRDGAEQVGLTGLEQAALDRYRIRLVG